MDYEARKVDLKMVFKAIRRTISLRGGMCITEKKLISFVFCIRLLIRSISLQEIDPSASNRSIAFTKFTPVSPDPANPPDRLRPNTPKLTKPSFISLVINKKGCSCGEMQIGIPGPSHKICTYTYPPYKYVVPQLTRAVNDGLQALDALISEPDKSEGNCFSRSSKDFGEFFIVFIMQSVLRLVNKESEHRQPQ